MTTKQADRLSAEAITDHALWIGANETVARQAASRVVSDPALVLLGINGWLASGKDSVAPSVLAELGVRDAGHVFYARALKDELDLIIAVVADASVPETAERTVSAMFDVPAPHAHHMVTLLWQPTHSGGLRPTAYSRTDEVRLALQYLGTDIRRAQDPDYWVKRTLLPVVSSLAEGRPLFATDVRFANEVTGSQQLGFRVVRLDITRETQRQRLLARDGLEPDPKALYHASETALDDYAGFDLRIDNDGELRDTVAQVAALWR